VSRRGLWLHEEALPPPLFARLRRRLFSLGEERLRASYQTTFWHPFAEPPDDVVAEAALALKVLLPRQAGLRGVEWWLSRMRTSNVQVDFHQDRDERLMRATGKMVHPTYSSLLFLNRCRGGLLAVTDALPNEANRAMAPDRGDFDLVAPRPNRFAVFRGHLTHGVLDSANQIPGVRRPREARLRWAIAINFWDHRPTETPTFGESSHYRKLGLHPTY
jgi:hypothetical protein